MDLTKNGATLETLVAEVTWEQPQHSGMLGGLRNRAGRTDVDLNAIVIAGSQAIDYADPKTHPVAQDGCVAHGGDAKSAQGGGEKIVMKLSDLDDDITAIAFALTCASGRFDKITNAKIVFRDGNGELLGRQRLNVMTDHNGAAVGYVRRTAGTKDWTFTESMRYGRVDYAKLASGQSWRDLANLALTAVTGR